MEWQRYFKSCAKVVVNLTCIGQYGTKIKMSGKAIYGFF